MKNRLTFIMQEVSGNLNFYANTNFLKNGTEESINDFPIIDKKMVRERYNDFVSGGNVSRENDGMTIVQHTSGSTGEPFKVVWNMLDYERSLLLGWRIRIKSVELSSRKRVLSFYSTRYINNTLIKDNQSPVQSGNTLMLSKLNLDENNFANIIEQVENFKPTIVISQPSIALIIKDLYEQNGINKFPFEIQMLELTGEFLTLADRATLKSFFNAPIRNCYSLTEFNTVAFECNQGSLHILQDNVFVEIVDDKGEQTISGCEGNIVISSLTNRTMPLLRYKTGDHGILKNSNCICGSKSPILEITAGRDGDFVLCSNGDKVNYYVFQYAIDQINSHFNNCIIQFKIHQTSYSSIQVTFIIKEDYMSWQSEIQKRFLACIKEDRLKPFNWKFTFSNKIMQIERSGKVSHFERSI